MRASRGCGVTACWNAHTWVLNAFTNSRATTGSKQIRVTVCRLISKSQIFHILLKFVAYSVTMPAGGRRGEINVQFILLFLGCVHCDWHFSSSEHYFLETIAVELTKCQSRRLCVTCCDVILFFDARATYCSTKSIDFCALESFSRRVSVQTSWMKNHVICEVCKLTCRFPLGAPY